MLSCIGYCSNGKVVVAVVMSQEKIDASKVHEKAEFSIRFMFREDGAGIFGVGQCRYDAKVLH